MKIDLKANDKTASFSHLKICKNLVNSGNNAAVNALSDTRPTSILHSRFLKGAVFVSVMRKYRRILKVGFSRPLCYLQLFYK